MNGETTTALRDDFLRLYPGDAADVLELRPHNEIAEVLVDVDANVGAVVLASLTPDVAARALSSLPDGAFTRLVRALPVTRAAILLSRLDPDEREARVRLLEGTLARELTDLLSYPPDTAGHLMDPRAMTFHPDTTATQAIDRLRLAQEDRFVDVFLVDDDGRLVGAVPLDRIATAPPDRPLHELVTLIHASLPVTAGIEEILEVAGDHRGLIPVVDADTRLLGAIRPRALVAAAEEDASADLQTMVGVSREERALSPAAFAVRRRLPWLFINLVTAFVAAGVVGVFESTIAQVSALAVLMPVVAGQSGNGGAQALAVAMRGLAIRELRTSQWQRLLWKEAAVGLTNGIAIAIVCGIGVIAWSRSTGLGIVIATAMVISMTVAGIAGASVPLALKALGQDPAQSSSIVLTTVTDVVGFLTFLGLATLLVGQL